MQSDVLQRSRSSWDRLLAWGCVLAGVITLVVGWLGVNATEFTAKQAAYIAGCGLGGIFLICVGATVWLSSDFRSDWRRLDRIEAAIRSGSRESRVTR